MPRITNLGTIAIIAHQEHAVWPFKNTKEQRSSELLSGIYGSVARIWWKATKVLYNTNT